MSKPVTNIAARARKVIKDLYTVGGPKAVKEFAKALKEQHNSTLVEQLVKRPTYHQAVTADILTNFLIWHDTSQGQRYWYIIYSDLRKLQKKELANA